MNSRFLCTVLLLVSANFLFASPQLAAGKTQGPVVAVITGTQGALNLLHEGAVVQGWVFPGPFTCSVILAGPLDTLEWDGEAPLLLSGETDPADVARKALEGSASPRLVFVNSNGATQVIKTVSGEEEMNYDAASAATAE